VSRGDAERVAQPGRNAWRVEQATRVAVIIDAEDYFRAVRDAMLKAKHQILLIGWDFDARIRLAEASDAAPDAPEQVGPFLTWLANRSPDLHIHLLRWDTGAIKSFFRPRTLATIARWLVHPRIHARLDGHHPPAGSHHQKIVVIDDCLAFCGGIDMTAGRWDTRAHRDDDPGRISPDGKPCMPWHDATTALQGPIAAALGELARDRWQLSGGKALPVPPRGGPCWPDCLEPDFSDIPAAISRTAPEMKDAEPIHEIEQLYLDLIARAERTIYAESQYFASRRIAEAIARRLDEPNGPEIVIVNPTQADGWLEQLAMDTARARLVEALRRHDRHGRFRLYHPVTADGREIYVHAKVLVVDEEVIRVGSSNFNNRSLRLDTECDVTMVDPAAALVRDDLLAEHLAVDPAEVTRRLADGASMIAAIEALRREGKTLIPYDLPELSAGMKWLADSELLDPESPDDMFEAPSRRPGLLKRLRRR
jgi:phosphatidylserine/phosphatidylglycerophosphate/cardiolipin synthase-like enzyme